MAEFVSSAPVALHTTLEIGTGRAEPEDMNSLWESVPERRVFGPNEQYIGVEIGAGANPRFRQMLMSGEEETVKEEVEACDQRMRQAWAAMQESRPQERLSFCQASGIELPLRKASVDVVIMANMFGRGAPEPTLADIYQETNRVLRPGGEIILHDEIMMPRFVDNDSLQSWLEQNGLPLPEHQTRLNAAQDTSQYVEACGRYGLSKLTLHKPLLNRDSMLWILRKAIV